MTHIDMIEEDGYVKVGRKPNKKPQPAPGSSNDQWARLRAEWPEICPRISFEQVEGLLFNEGYIGLQDLLEMEGGTEGREFSELFSPLLKGPELRRMKKMLGELR